MDAVEWAIDSQLFDVAPLIHMGKPIGIDESMSSLGQHGRFGAIDAAEGVVYRVERRLRNTPDEVDFLAKYVRPDKVDGCYLPEISGAETIWNWRP